MRSANVKEDEALFDIRNLSKRQCPNVDDIKHAVKRRKKEDSTKPIGVNNNGNP
ncbi:2934_t:CDS:2, partial [Cetraspora pellucida]